MSVVVIMNCIYWTFNHITTQIGAFKIAAGAFSICQHHDFMQSNVSCFGILQMMPSKYVFQASLSYPIFYYT